MLRFTLYLLFCAFTTSILAQNDFARAEKMRDWKFPRDHGQHPAYQTEWWYFTGNVKTENGRRFGYELTFFRQALAPAILPRESQWAFRDVYIAHFAITDIAKGKFYYTQKSARGALHLAGADSALLAVHLGDWSARQENGREGEQIRLRAASDFGEIDFVLQALRPPVFHGDHGLLPNSHLPGDAVYYYSLPVLQTTGILRCHGESFRLTGSSWMDHEFFTPIANPQVIGWDWLSLHLSDSTAVMLAQWRQIDGSISPYATGTFIRREGTTQIFSAGNFSFIPQAWWTSPTSGGKYPVAWKIKFLDYELQLRTPVANQELDTRRSTGKIYWEGCVEVSGKKGQQEIRGEGYLEMTGYVK
ncbi:MAG: hypothetical protein ALAOOOJD_01619 [bacterium]|nr:hypothetical protein [bacterium]